MTVGHGKSRFTRACRKQTVHSAHKAGATPEEIYQVIDSVGGWAGGAARQNGMEAWRRVFRPDLPPIDHVVELTDDSFER